MIDVSKGFTAHFMEIGLNRKEAPCCFEDLYDITWDGRTIHPDDWADLVAHAKKTPIQLVLSRRYVESFESEHAC
jgi:hypothetical protein